MAFAEDAPTTSLPQSKPERIARPRVRSLTTLLDNPPQGTGYIDGALT